MFAFKSKFANKFTNASLCPPLVQSKDHQESIQFNLAEIIVTEKLTQVKNLCSVSNSKVFMVVPLQTTKICSLIFALSIKSYDRVIFNRYSTSFKILVDGRSEWQKFPVSAKEAVDVNIDEGYFRKIIFIFCSWRPGQLFRNCSQLMWWRPFSLLFHLFDESSQRKIWKTYTYTCEYWFRFYILQLI